MNRPDFMSDPDAHLFAPRTASAPFTVERRDPDRIVGIAIKVVALALCIALGLGVIAL